VKAWSDLDLSYTYRNLDLMGNDANITLGARNLFDREAQRSPEFAGVIGGLQDPLGRVITARLQVNF
jgi:outer membrane receptor protein involved in Fe transport